MNVLGMLDSGHSSFVAVLPLMNVTAFAAPSPDAAPVATDPACRGVEQFRIHGLGGPGKRLVGSAGVQGCRGPAQLNVRRLFLEPSGTLGLIQASGTQPPDACSVYQ